MNVYLLYNKNEALDVFKVFKAEVENQCGKQIKIVRSDRGGEYYDKYTENGQTHGPFTKFLQENGVVAQYIMHVLQIIMIWQKEGTKHYWTWYGVCLATLIFLNLCGLKH